MSDNPTLTADVAGVPRDEQGSLLPEDVPIEVDGQTYDAKMVRPTTGKIREYEAQEGADFDNMDDGALDIIWEEHVVEPDCHWADLRADVFTSILTEFGEMVGVSNESVLDAIEEREQSIEDSGN